MKSNRFRVPKTHVLDEKDHILLDNLWVHRNSPAYAKILDVMATHLNYKNRASFEISFAETSLAPHPRSLTQTLSADAYLRKEHELKKKEIQIELLQKELNEAREKLEKEKREKDKILKEYEE